MLLLVYCICTYNSRCIHPYGTHKHDHHIHRAHILHLYICMIDTAFVKCWKVLMMPVMLHPYPLLYTYIYIFVCTSESYRYIDIDWLKHKFLQCAVVHVMFIYAVYRSLLYFIGAKKLIKRNLYAKACAQTISHLCYIWHKSIHLRVYREGYVSQQWLHDGWSVEILFEWSVELMCLIYSAVVYACALCI